MENTNSIFAITQNTKAIITNQSDYFKTVILEGKYKHYSTHRAEKILDVNCIHFGSSLTGRRTAVRNLFKIYNKIPVSVNPLQGVYMMPTSSVKSKDCVWLSYYHIDYYVQQDNQTYVVFMDGSGLLVNVSINSLDMQYKRTSQIIARLNRPIFFSSTNK